MFRRYVQERRSDEWLEFWQENMGSALDFDDANREVRRVGDLAWQLWLTTSAPRVRVAIVQPNRDLVPASPGMLFPGGIVAISKTWATQMRDDVLAFVVAHELAHQALGHVPELPLGPSALIRLGTRGLFRKLVAHRSRQAELAADALGHQWASEAGYPEGGPRLFRYWTLRHSESPRAFRGRSHPTPAARLLHLGYALEDVPPRSVRRGLGSLPRPDRSMETRSGASRRARRRRRQKSRKRKRRR